MIDVAFLGAHVRPAATAITGGTLGLSAPRRSGGWTLTHSLIVRPGSVRRIVESRPATDQE